MAAAIRSGEADGMDAGVGPLGANTSAAGGGSAGWLGAGGQSGMAGAGRGGARAAGAAGSGGAAGAAESACGDVFCFTPIECLFLTLPCGFTDCINFSCR